MIPEALLFHLTHLLLDHSVIDVFRVDTTKGKASTSQIAACANLVAGTAFGQRIVLPVVGVHQVTQRVSCRHLAKLALRQCSSAVYQVLQGYQSLFIFTFIFLQRL